ncbi:MAG: asparagine synthase (glutamine-hydrolyzing) [Nitrospinota bacterium]
MCGIAGVITREGFPELREALLRMVRAQTHRGPDDEGIKVFGARGEVLGKDGPRAEGPHVALGSRRLAIIDLSSSGHQPMTNEDGTLWIVYNGEIYNFMELRQDLLSKGHKFRSNTDTEVILHLYEQYGEGCLKYLRGMFAFGMWDKRNRCLFIARDRLGKKPLYYSWDGKRFLFASEIKALLASDLVERRLNPAAVVAYLTFGSVPVPVTIIKGIEALLPGCYLKYQVGRVELKRYWHIPFSENPDLSEAETIETLRGLLEEAVRLRLVSDVPIGAFLSGGIDSSVIVALMRKITGGSIRTFSMTFREQEFSEACFAEQVARKFGTEHTEYVVTAEEVRNELEKIVWAMDQPTVDGVNTYFVSKVARQSGTVVALSGLGGDELFGGYSSFLLVPRLCRVSRLVRAIPGGRRALERVLGRPGQTRNPAN